MNNVMIGGSAVLAPMAGISDYPFRSICKEYGAALVFTEMVSAEGVVRDNQRTEKYLFFREEERPIAIQLFGGKAHTIAEAVRRLEYYKPDFLDLNFGCPVRKVIRQGAGAALLKDLRQLGSVCRAAVKGCAIPITAKIRSGWETDAHACDIARVIVDNGVAAITVHARTRRDQFTGKANWDIIERIKNSVQVPVIGNGDIRDEFDAQQMLDRTGCDLVMVGRGALGNPFIFRQINSYLAGGEAPAPTTEERILTCLRHFNRAWCLAPSISTIQNMKKHIGWYLKGIPDVREVRKEIFSCERAEQVISRLNLLLRERGGERSLTANQNTGDG